MVAIKKKYNKCHLYGYKPAILNRWAEHVSAVLNRRRSYCPPATSWDKHWSRQTTQRGRSQEGNQASLYWKSPRCRCHPFRYQHGGDMLLQKLTYISCRMWDEEVIPQQLKDASIISLYKKGNRQLCDNYRGISLLAIAGKILARVLLNRLIVHFTWNTADLQRVNAASEVAVGPLTWSSLPANCRRNANSSMTTSS